MKKFKKIVLWSLIILIIVILLAITALFVFRDSLLQEAIQKTEAKLDSDFDCTFSIKKASFEGLSGIEIQDLVLKPKKADTLIAIKNFKTEVNLFPLLVGELQIKRLEMQKGYIQLIRNEKGSNFSAFLGDDGAEEVEVDYTNYAAKAYRILNKLLNLVPTDMKLNQIDLRVDDRGNKIALKLNHLNLVDQQLESRIQVVTPTLTQQWRINGFADPRNKKADVMLFNGDTSRIYIPFIDKKFHIKSSFSNLHFNLNRLEMEDDNLHIDGYTSIENFTVNHRKIAHKDVVIQKARFDYRFLLGPNSIAVDSSSTLQLNQLKIHPFAEFNTESDTVYKLQLDIPNTQAQNLISSLPKGLFSHFEGMQVTGNVAYKMKFNYNKNKPKELIFDSNLKKDNLKILAFGEANLAKVNGDFVYRAIENGILQRPIYVGYSNPNYTALEQMSPYLKKCVLTSEDPSFFHHNGFIHEAFRQSILQNIKTKRFTRGASTISMQLVKNVFLTREKTLSRKLEEILLVYILENNRIVSKQRMLEVYFNIIEWGPNVYGIGEASQFYFQKSPSDLNLKECLFLASIIPKPKKFMWQFDNQGFLKPFAARHQKYIRNIMNRRGLLSVEDTIGQGIPLTLTGRARNSLRLKQVQDSIPADSLFIEVLPPVE